MRTALYLQDLHPIRDGMAYSQYAEERGFEAVWQAESRLVREATVPMAAYAGGDEADQSGLGGHPDLDPQRRSARRDLLHPGRARAGPRHLRSRRLVGAARHKSRCRPPAPVRAMREVVEATRRLLQMERVTYHGEFVHLDDVEIDIVHGDRSRSTCRSTSGRRACR